MTGLAVHVLLELMTQVDVSNVVGPGTGAQVIEPEKPGLGIVDGLDPPPAFKHRSALVSST